MNAEYRRPMGLMAGHVVAVAERRWIVDASLDQANSIDGVDQNSIGIALPGVYFAKVTDDFLAGRSMNLMNPPLNGCRLMYDAMPRDRDYRTVAPTREDVNAVASDLIETLEDALPRLLIVDAQ